MGLKLSLLRYLHRSSIWLIFCLSSCNYLCNILLIRLILILGHVIIALYIHFFHYLSIPRWHMKDMFPFILYSRYHDRWWSGDARSQDINSQDIDPVCMEYSGSSASSVKIPYTTCSYNCWALTLPNSGTTLIQWTFVLKMKGTKAYIWCSMNKLFFTNIFESISKVFSNVFLSQY